jgi:hypothetical protein
VHLGGVDEVAEDPHGTALGQRHPLAQREGGRLVGDGDRDQLAIVDRPLS